MNLDEANINEINFLIILKSAFFSYLFERVTQREEDTQIFRLLVSPQMATTVRAEADRGQELYLGLLHGIGPHI